MLGKLNKGEAEGSLYTLQRFLDRSRWRRYWDDCQRFNPRSVKSALGTRAATISVTFQAGQNVAAIKYVEPFLSAPDWWTWAYPGDGSRMGLNIVLGAHQSPLGRDHVAPGAA